MQFRSIFILLVVQLVASSHFKALAQPSESSVKDRVSSFVQREIPRLGKKAKAGIAVADAVSGDLIFSYHETEQLTPASILKIITSAVVLRELGSEYRFVSDVYIDRTGAKPADLYFEGSGDPSLVSERLWLLAQDIQARGVKQVRDIIVDDSRFLGAKDALGPRAYQAGMSAVSLNHNCYAVQVTPSTPGKPAHVTVTKGLDAEVINNVTTVSTGETRVSVAITGEPGSPAPAGSGAKRPRLVVSGTIHQKKREKVSYQTVSSPPHYLGSVFRTLLEGEGVVVTGRVREGKIPTTAELLTSTESKDLALVLRDLNHYSNNFIADQLVFQLGRDETDQFQHALGIEKMTRYLERLGFSRTSFAIFDGSGLSRSNRLTAMQLVSVLTDLYRDFGVAPTFTSSLSRFGLSGTLKKRRLNSGGAEVWAKTGTLNGVKTLAGYAASPAGRRFAFVVMINGHQSGDRVDAFEEGLLEALTANG